MRTRPRLARSIRSRPSVSGGSWARSGSGSWTILTSTPPALAGEFYVTDEIVRGLAAASASADPVGFCQMISGVLFAFGAALLDGVSVPF